VLLWVHVILPFTKQTLAANLYNRGLQVRVLWMQLLHFGGNGLRV
jgi:hypothetical protein